MQTPPQGMAPRGGPPPGAPGMLMPGGALPSMNRPGPSIGMGQPQNAPGYVPGGPPPFVGMAARPPQVSQYLTLLQMPTAVSLCCSIVPSASKNAAPCSMKCRYIGAFIMSIHDPGADALHEAALVLWDCRLSTNSKQPLTA